MNLCIDKPFFIGCTKIDLTNYLTQEQNWTLCVQDIDELGVPTGSQINFPVLVSLQQTDYKICFALYPNSTFNEFTSNKQSICDFQNCKFVLKFPDVKLTVDGGFPLCNVPTETCSQVCGGLSLCSTTPYQWGFAKIPDNWSYGTVEISDPPVTLNDGAAVGLQFNDVTLIPTTTQDGSKPVTVPFQLKRDVWIQQITEVQTNGIGIPGFISSPVTPIGPPILVTDFFDFSDPQTPIFQNASLGLGNWCFEVCYEELGPNGGSCPNTIIINKQYITIIPDP
jgi:hypothetical protein